MSTQQPQIGWIGLGNMGLAMATNLQKHLASRSLPPLLFTNRTLSRGDPLKALGASASSSPTDIFSKCDLIFSCISDDEAVESTYSTILSSLSPAELAGKFVFEMTTIHPDTSCRVSASLAESGVTFLSVPVFGATVAAQNSQLILLLSGPPTAISAILPFADGVLGRMHMNLGASVRTAPLLKLSGNAILLSLVEVLSEAYAVADKSGLGSAPLSAFVEQMFGGVMQQYSERITKGLYAPPEGVKPSFAVELALKDGKHAQGVARQAGAETPTLDAALKNLKEARESRPGELDSTSMYGTLRVKAGLPFYSDAVSKRADQ
ncbi:hypothetical protein P7C70_g3902, partial [Phenoliferia sp. Uapishka_3]